LRAIRPVTDTNTHGHSNGYGHTNSYANADTDGNGDSDCNWNSHIDAHTHAYGDRDSHSNANTHTNCNRHGNADFYSHTYSDANGDSYTDSYSDAYADPYANPMYREVFTNTEAASHSGATSLAIGTLGGKDGVKSQSARVWPLGQRMPPSEFVSILSSDPFSFHQPRRFFSRHDQLPPDAMCLKRRVCCCALAGYQVLWGGEPSGKYTPFTKKRPCGCDRPSRSR
jgi:hypothetical protein